MRQHKSALRFSIESDFLRHRFRILNRPMKILALIIGSLWFFPVSCTSSLYAGMHVASYLDERDTTRGDQIHPAFSIVAEPGVDGQSFRMVRLAEIEPFRKKGMAKIFLMSQSSGELESGGYASVSYRVLQGTPEAQEIEVIDVDDDRTVWSRYRATATGVTPLGSRMFYVGYMYQALPFAMLLALLVYAGGRLLWRRTAGAGVPDGPDSN